MLSLKVNLFQKDTSVSTSSGKMYFECPKAHLQKFWAPGCLNYSVLYGGAQCLWVLGMELFHVTLLAPTIWRFLLDYWKFSEHLPCNIEGYLYICTKLFVHFDAFHMYVVMRGTKLFEIITYSVTFVE